MITIPKNSYVPPTEVREEVVQAICEAFLYGIIQNNWEAGGIYHPKNEGSFRDADKFIELRNGKGIGFCNRAYSLCNKSNNPENFLKFNAAEMERAFKELRDAGYHMLQVREYGTWKGYMCSVKSYADWVCFEKEVFDFTDQID